MKIVNDTPFKISWLVGYVSSHKLSGTFIFKGTFDLRHGKLAIPSELQVEPDGDLFEEETNDACRYASDFVPLKLKTDLVLVGSACAPRDELMTARNVRFKIGEWEKSLAVIGDRTFKKGVLVGSVPAPKPFSKMPIDYRHAYGGATFPDNPVGKGHEETNDPDGQLMIQLPNVVRPGEHQAGFKSNIEPASFAPIAPNWPRRMRIAKRATYDRGWMKTHWPGYPVDFDWSYFNVCPPDQQLSKALIGNESVRIEGMHPDHEVYEFQLPGVRPRWFIYEKDFKERQQEGETYKDSDQKRRNEEQDHRIGPAREVELRLDTLWIDMDAEKAILVWRGVTSLKTKKMKEIACHFILTEPVEDDRKPIDYYTALLPTWRNELDEADAGESSPLLEGAIPPLEIPKQTFDWGQWEKDFDSEIKQTQAELEKEDERMLDQTGPDNPDRFLAKFGIKTSLFDNPVPSDPGIMANQEVQALKSLFETNPGLAKDLGPPAEPEDFAIDAEVAEIEKDFVEMEEKLKDMASTEEEEVTEPDSSWTRDRCIQHAKNKGDFSYEDLTEVDLSGLDLTGLKFHGAILKGANLVGTNLEAAELNRAQLESADLSRSILRKAILNEADFTHSRLIRVDLTEAQMVDSSFFNAQLEESDMCSVSASGANFFSANLRNVRLEKADLTKAIFDEACLEGASLQNSILENASAYGSRSTKVVMQSSKMTGFRGGENADFRGANLINIDGDGSVWEGANLSEANLIGASLVEASFCDADLTMTNFSKCDLRRARIVDANLEGATVMNANLFRVILEDSCLRGANFQGSNLYEAEFLDAIVENADFLDANLKGTKLG